MGHPSRRGKKYSTPRHPWQSERLEREKIILENYSLKNKKEINKMRSLLHKYTDQAKKLANAKTEQAKKEKKQLIDKLFKLGLVKKTADIDDVLGLTINNILDRRLQTMVYKSNMANTIKQARQFIVHGHVFVGDKKMSVPSYLVNLEEENKIKFKDNSNLTGKFGVKEEEKKKKVAKKEEKPKEESKKQETKKTSKEKPKKEEKKLEEKKENAI
ncbi:30S ribosomal protein S4 [Candidatus Woesearchaeota archaeon]|nr:30S ribosomal protein S4 [Candidatus Woesearchaeota archaeon]